METKDPILREKELDGYRSIAQKIRNRLQQLENANEKDKRRWIWELLQNAIDAGNGNKVDVEVTLNENEVVFRHNGGFFSPRNVTNLVHQISSKEGTESIGRFGTGFLTTHTLSREVVVESIYKNNNIFYPFKLLLDRKGSTEQELVLGIEKTWDIYRQNERIPSENQIFPFWTCFFYKNPNIEIAKATLADCETYIFYCFAFVENLHSFSIKNELDNSFISYIRKKNESLGENIVSFEKKVNEIVTEVHLYTLSDNKISIAIEVEEKEGKMRIKPIPSTTPRLFCAYPLIGTEDFYFPFVINSTHFIPKTERDKLYLKGETSDASKNKEILAQTLDLYKKAVDELSSKKWGNLFEIAKHQLPPYDDDFDRDWYAQKIQQEIQKKLLTVPIVENESGELMYIERIQENDSLAFFPYAENKNERELIWKFAYDLYPQSLPLFSQIHEWYEIVWEDCEKQDLELLVEDVSSFLSVEELAEQLQKNEEETLDWLNTLIEFVEISDSKLLDKYAVLPNQYNKFKHKKELYEDKDKVEPVLLDILKDLGEDWRENYLHLAMTNAEMNGKVRWLNNLILSMNTIIDRDENYRFTEITAKKLLEKGERMEIVSLAESIKDKLFNKKEEYLRELKRTFTAYLPTIEKTILDNSKDTEMRKAISAIITLCSPETKENTYRNQMYDFVQLFDISVSPRIEVLILREDTWAKADIWMLKALISDIENAQNTKKLAEKLAKTPKETLAILNAFFSFLLENNKLELLSEKAVYPNQEDFFCKKSELFEDIHIPKELKKILFDFNSLNQEEDCGWERMLLHTSITAFQEKHKLSRKTVRDISDEINKIVINTPLNTSEESRNILLRLLCYSNNVTEKQTQIWEFARAMYMNDTPESIKTLENSAEFDWNVCFDWIVKYMVSNVSDLKYTEKLQKKLAGNIEVIDWLDRLISFLQKQEEWQILLEEYAIIPNQNGDFSIKSILYLDDEIPSALKEVIRAFHYEWVGELVDTKVYLKGLPSNRTRTKKEAALEVDRIFKEYKDSPQSPKYVGAWRTLQKWLKQESEDFIRENLDWISRHRAEVTLAALGTDEEKDNILQIIESGNAGIFNKIAEGLTKQELKQLADNPNEYKEFKEWKENNKESISEAGVLEKFNQATGKRFESIEEIITTFKQNSQKINFAYLPTGNNGGGNADMVAIAKSNEEAKEELYKELSKRKDENGNKIYNIDAWKQESNTIISGVKKQGIDIKIVIKGAKHGTIYFDKAGKEQRELSDTFSELWVWNGEKVFPITIGDVIEKWDMVGIKAFMFDFNDTEL